MRIYTVIHHDRHTDPVPFLFQKKEDALESARDIAKTYDIDPENKDRKEDIRAVPTEEGLFFSQSLSEEGDRIFIYECDLEYDAGDHWMGEDI